MSTTANSKINIILVEDDTRLSNLICAYLRSLSFEVEAIHDGALAVTGILDKQPQLVILDLMLPNVDGLEICRQLRPDFSAPILMLTASDDDINEVSALNEGVDDYLCKPLRPHILHARINALLRRHGSASNSLSVADLVLHLNKRYVEQAGTRLELTDAEYELLKVLITCAGEILSRERLFTLLRGISYDGMDRSIDQRIVTLRRKLNDQTSPHRYIQSIRGKGYLLCSDD
ncbi:response regulator [Agaribacterium sp. ZY112]|uniref:response regulator n=1 Tax=Agaribacterium sp. ZY112 TaxID=3233574 RepID=UPI003524F652